MSRSPSPRPGGGWTTPGLGESSQAGTYNGMNGNNGVTWASAKAKSDAVKGYPSFSTRNEGFFSRSRRKISSSLPTFNRTEDTKKDWRETEKLGRGRWRPSDSSPLGKLKTFLGNLIRKFRLFFILMLAIVLGSALFSLTRKSLLPRLTRSTG